MITVLVVEPTLKRPRVRRPDEQVKVQPLAISSRGKSKFVAKVEAAGADDLSDRWESLFALPSRLAATVGLRPQISLQRSRGIENAAIYSPQQLPYEGQRALVAEVGSLDQWTRDLWWKET